MSGETRWIDRQAKADWLREMIRFVTKTIKWLTPNKELHGEKNFVLHDLDIMKISLLAVMDCPSDFSKYTVKINVTLNVTILCIFTALPNTNCLLLLK